SIAAKSIKPEISVIGAEPELADDAYRSLKAGSIQPVLRTDTVADGLRTSLGSLTFQIISEKLDDIITVSEKSIINNLRSVCERMKIIVEPSSVVALSATLDGNLNAEGKKIGIIFTGGNIDLDNLPWNKV
ncbi:MAG: pyridoxal-phosphate dependent enzyme, partial [Balneolaceae bacterium]|nr:pyridoxal-phosphate dependent enzyme [Balneolaceae bacterium]